MEFESERAYTFDNIVIDSNNFFMRYYSVESAKTKQESYDANVGSIANAIRGLNKLLREYGNIHTHVYLLFDNAKSKMNVRKLIDPGYKLNRQRKSEAFYRSLDMFRLIMLSYRDNMSVVFGTGHEADDIAPVVIGRTTGSVLVVSEDMDWCRLITNRVQLLNRNGVVGKKKFLEKYKFSPTENGIILYKTFHGDTVDNIPVGVLNIPKHLTVRLIDDYADIYEVVENLDIIDYLSGNWKTKIREAKSRLFLNHELVSYIPISETNIDKCMVDCHYKPKILKTIYKTLDVDMSGVDTRVQVTVPSKNEKSWLDDFLKEPKPKRW